MKTFRISQPKPAISVPQWAGIFCAVVILCSLAAAYSTYFARAV